MNRHVIKLTAAMIVLNIATLSDSLSHSDAFSPKALAHNLHRLCCLCLCLIDSSMRSINVASASNAIAELDGLWGLAVWPEVNPKSIRDKIYLILKMYPIQLILQILNIGKKNRLICQTLGLVKRSQPLVPI